MRHHQIAPIALLAVLLAQGCAVSSRFDQNSLNAALELKSEALTLISMAEKPASEFSYQLTNLQSKLEAQLAYEEGKGKCNSITFAQWKLLVSPNSELLGGFLRQWKEGRPFSKPYIEEKSWQIGEAFDVILRSEGAKIK